MTRGNSAELLDKSPFLRDLQFGFYKFLKQNKSFTINSNEITQTSLSKEKLKSCLKDSLFVKTAHIKLKSELIKKNNDLLSFLRSIITNDYIYINLEDRKIVMKSRDFVWLLIEMLEDNLFEENSIGLSTKFYILSEGKTKRKATMILNSARTYLKQY